MFSTQKKSVRVGKMVDTDHVNTVIRNYKRERWVHNSKRIGKEDSLSVWYSVEELEDFLARVREHGGDGIKLYFGAYGEDYTGNPLYAGRQTVVFVATKAREAEQGTVNKDLYINKEEGSTILAYNFGSLCPPYCSTGDGMGIGVTILDKGDEGLIVA
jgi:hypothetical protein